MTKLAVSKRETYDYAIRLIANPGHIIGMSFDRARMERLRNEWNERDGEENYEVVQRLRVVSDWYRDPLDTLV